MNLPTFDQLHVISDLHLGGPTGRQIFASTQEASKFIEQLTGISDKRVGLVINCDLVDFLAEENACCFDIDPESAEKKLRDIIKRQEFNPVFLELRKFVKQAGHQLAINLGNHDLELALPPVRRTLLDWLADGDDAARGRITLVQDGSGYRAQVGSAQVICLHGNEVDAWNVTDYEKLRRLGRDVSVGRQVDPWKPNAGSQMVVEVMNDVKGTWPFVDLLKPEREAVPLILLALDPQLGWKVKEIARFAATAKAASVRREAGFLGEEEITPMELNTWLNAGAERPVFLGEPANDFSPPTHDLLSNVEKRLLQKLNEDGGAGARFTLMDEIEGSFQAKTKPVDLLVSDYEAAYLGKMNDLWAATAGWVQKAGINLSAWLAGEGRRVLRKSLECLVEDRVFELNDASDETYREIDAKVGPEFQFVITGHTHLERALRRTNGSGFYLNTGTWAGIMQLGRTTLESDTEFEKFYQHLKAGKLDVLEQNKLITRNNTVASITAGAAGIVRGELRHVKMVGTSLVAESVPGSECQFG